MANSQVAQRPGADAAAPRSLEKASASAESPAASAAGGSEKPSAAAERSAPAEKSGPAEKGSSGEKAPSEKQNRGEKAAAAAASAAADSKPSTTERGAGGERGGAQERGGKNGFSKGGRNGDGQSRDGQSRAPRGPRVFESGQNWGQSGRGESRGRGSRGGRGGGGAYGRQAQQQQAFVPLVPPPQPQVQQSLMPVDAVAPHGAPAGMRSPQYFPMASPMFYPPAAFGIPARSVPGAPTVSNNQLQEAVRRQIEYYFSVQNLCRDIFLRSKMNDGGWIPVHLVASFNRVRMLTPDISVIIESMQVITKLNIPKLSIS